MGVNLCENRTVAAPNLALFLQTLRTYSARSWQDFAQSAPMDNFLALHVGMANNA
jgi:hypothetical protein